MYRDEVVKLMCDVVNAYNRQMIGEQMPASYVENFIEQNAASLEHMNGLLYDALKDYGVIA